MVNFRMPEPRGMAWLEAERLKAEQPPRELAARQSRRDFHRSLDKKDRDLDACITNVVDRFVELAEERGMQTDIVKYPPPPPGFGEKKK